MTSEELFDEIQEQLKVYKPIIKTLEKLKCSQEQISKVLLLIYHYQLVNALNLNDDEKSIYLESVLK